MCADTKGPRKKRWKEASKSSLQGGGVSLSGNCRAFGPAKIQGQEPLIFLRTAANATREAHEGRHLCSAGQFWSQASRNGRDTPVRIRSQPPITSRPLPAGRPAPPPGQPSRRAAQERSNKQEHLPPGWGSSYLAAFESLTCFKIAARIASDERCGTACPLRGSSTMTFPPLSALNAA